MKISRNPYAFNWTEWQLCFECANILHAEHYKDRPRRGTGGKFLNDDHYNDFTSIHSE